MKRYKILIVLFLLALKATAQQIDLLVVIDNSPPLRVNYFKEGDLKKNAVVGAVFGPIAGSLYSTALVIRNDKYSKSLQDLIGNFPEREQYIIKMLETGFYNETDKIKLHFINSKEAEKYFLKQKPNYDLLKKDNWSFIMTLTETAGYSTLNRNLGTLSPSTSLKTRVYNVNTNKRIFSQKFNSHLNAVFQLDSALSNKAIFKDNYPTIINSLTTSIYFRLNGKDVFHEMGKAHGLEAEFPSTKKLLKEYRKSFKYWSQLPDGWIDINSKNDFLFISSPKKDKALVGLRTDIDLLIKSFGQDNLDIDNYVDIRATRLEDANLPVRPFDENIPSLDLKDEWVYYMVDNPNGGISLMLSRILYEEYTINHEIILLGDNPIGLLEKHKKDIESYINKSTITLTK